VKQGVYKLGDFGLVTAAGGNDGEVMEGDCRYMPVELMKDDFSNLPKCDVFSLGTTAYELALGTGLPCNGQEWHDIREGKLEDMTGYSKEFQDMVKSMLRKNPRARPAITDLLADPLLLSDHQKKLAKAEILASALNRTDSERRAALAKKVDALGVPQFTRAATMPF
jgi:wee1-like protein kinase